MRQRGSDMTGAVMVMIASIAAFTFFTGCDNTPDVAPPSTTVTVAANPATVGIGGDSSEVDAIFTETTGDLVSDGTQVSFVATLGAMCPLQPQGVDTTCGNPNVLSPAALVTSTHQGVAKAVFRSGNFGGNAQITAKSGSVSGNTTIVVSASIAPANSTMLMSAQPDTIAINTGTSTIQVFVSSGNAPVQDATLIRFSTTAGAIAPAIALTQNGFASAVLSNVTLAGTAMVKAISGTVRDSITVRTR